MNPDGISTMDTALTASGVGYEADTGYVDYVHFRTYHSSGTETPVSVVNQFAADGLDGELRLTVTDQCGISVRHLTVFRRGPHGSATYWHGQPDGTRHWVTVAAQQTARSPTWTMHTFAADGTGAQAVVLPFGLLHRAMLEFVATGHRPTTVPWQALPT
jgi:immunity protein Imm1 of predicted polymorphic toxin system